MNIQEQYNKMAAHVLQMTVQSKEDDLCKYQLSNGNRCAVGCLIPDDETKALKFFGPVEKLKIRFNELHWIDEDLATDFQAWHDNPDNWNEIKRAEYKSRYTSHQCFFDLGVGGLKDPMKILKRIAATHDLEPYGEE